MGRKGLGFGKGNWGWDKLVRYQEYGSCGWSISKHGVQAWMRLWHVKYGVVDKGV